MSVLASEAMKTSVTDPVWAALGAVVSASTILRRDEPLAKRTTMRVGGAADVWVEPASEEDLLAVVRFASAHGLPWMFVGRGSNLLVRDGGVRGLVVNLSQPVFSRIQIEGERIRCGAGARLRQVVQEACQAGLGGLEFLEGIPGTVGGALRMNAGAMGQAIFERVVTVRMMDAGGRMEERAAAEIPFTYRDCPALSNRWALAAELRCDRADTAAIRGRMDAYSKKRWASQPAKPSAGCVFKNPAAGPAGRLVDELGLKGTRVGGAVVSFEHGNFIVNDGQATAREVLALIEVVRQRVREARGVELETEVKIIGED